MSRGLILIVLCLLALAVGLGFIGGQGGDPGTAAYKRAEGALNQGNYTSALNAYRELISHYPKSQWADAAQYKISYLLAEYLGEPEKALNAVEALLRDYPESRYGDDALLLRAELLEKSLRDLPTALTAYAELAHRYPDQIRLQADAALGEARCLIEMKKQGAAQAAEEAVRITRDLGARQADALLLLATAQQEVAGDLTAAKSAYERVIRSYPDSEQAQRARERLGLLLYSLPKEGKKQARVLLDLPAAQSAREAEIYSLPLATPPLAPYLAYLGGLGGRWSAPALAAISGETWSLSFDPSHPEQSGRWMTANPFLQLAKALGIKAEWRRYRDPTAALETLKGLLGRGSPALIFADLPPPRWVVVVGVDPAAGEIYLYDPTSNYRAYALADFKTRWAAAANAGLRVMGEPSAGPLAVLWLAAPAASPPAAALLRGTLERLVALNRKRLPGDSLLLGWQAYDRMIALAERGARGEVEAGKSLAALKATALPHLAAAREVGAEGLGELAQAAGLPAAAAKAVGQALAAEAEQLRRAAEVLPRPSVLPPSEAQGPLSHANRGGLQQAGEHLRKALEASKRADSAARNLLARISG